jgi:tripartite-type tricarboxylate transporter receptor subunit TctC
MAMIRLFTTRLAGTVLAGIVLAATLAPLCVASAQTYPNAQVRLIVPTSPGGVTDTMARIVAQRLTEQLNQNVIVDNRAGGNGSVGAVAVANAPKDGLTLLVTSDATITANPSLSSKMPYSAKDFTPIIVLCRGTPMLVVNASVPANSVKELIALAKAKPGTLNYGSYGVGTYAHLSMEEFKQRTGTDIVHIPYRGATPAAQALLAGDVSMLLLNLSSIEAHEKTGKVRIIASASDKRAQARADLPTIAEAGVPGFATTVWFALFGPANMPPDLVNKIHADVSKVLDLPQTKEFFEKNSFERVTDSPAEFAKLVERDSQHWKSLIDQVGARVD